MAFRMARQPAAPSDLEPMTTEEVREFFHDEGRWAEPETQGARFDMWLAAHVASDHPNGGL